MAKLTAYGRKEVVRLTKEYSDNSGDRAKQCYVMMTDGSVLKKSVHWLQDRLGSSGCRRFDSGWKKWRKAKKGCESIVLAETIRRGKDQGFEIKDFRERITESGWWCEK